jgi:hypothetical protein
MTDNALSPWPRPHFQPGGGDAHFFFKVHGAFAGPPAISRSKYRCNGIPSGADVSLYAKDSTPTVFDLGTTDFLGGELRRTASALFDTVAGSDQCLAVRGEVKDPPTLDYLRDVVGVVTALLDGGGVGVFDAHAFRWFTPSEWRERIFEPAAAVPRHHVSILVSDEKAAGRRWFHTRGMRKFGRPDLSVHDVPPDLEPMAIDLCSRFIEHQAFGLVVPEGQVVRMNGLPDGWRCRHRGDLDDPDFNNRHIDVGPPPS